MRIQVNLQFNKIIIFQEKQKLAYHLQQNMFVTCVKSVSGMPF